MRGNLGQPRYLVSEIFLSVNSPEDEKSVEQLAERLVQQIGEGANFGTLAKQFSHAATAAVGGDAGWMQKGESAPEIDAALGSMKPGQILGPLRTLTGYHILALRDIEVIEAPKPEDITVSIAQVLLRYPADAKEADISSQKELAMTVSETATGCEDMNKLGKEIGATNTAVLEDVKVGDLAGILRPLAVSLEIGKASAPVDLKNGIAVVMVCERKDASNLPKPADVRSRIAMQRMNLRTRRYLRDLRRAAFLDVRV
jgi:peptidyl-prolyl cis-trans isomerase SurA